MESKSALTEFLSCYLNQDWMDLAPDPWACVRLYAYVEGPIEEVAERPPDKPATWSPSTCRATQLYERLLEDHGMHYMPRVDGYEANDWLSQVAGVLEDAVAHRRANG